MIFSEPVIGISDQILTVFMEFVIVGIAAVIITKFFVTSAQ